MDKKKIVIFEDEIDSLVYRFSDLTKKHDVSVYITGNMWDALDISSYKKQIEEGGFDTSKIKGVCYANRIGNPNWGEEYVEIPQADVYFTDGLQGDCFHILGKLPKEKAYLITDDNYIKEKAQKEDYQITTKDNLETIVQNIR